MKKNKQKHFILEITQLKDGEVNYQTSRIGFNQTEVLGLLEIAKNMEFNRYHAEAINVLPQRKS